MTSTPLADVASKTIESSVLDSTSVAVVGVVLIAASGAGVSLLLLPPVAAATLAAIACTSIVLRHAWLLRSKRTPMEQAWAKARQGAVPDAVALPSTYFVYVLGSGGHTSELCEMIKQQFRPNPLSHRRYIITSGDHHSENAVARLEGLIQATFPASGAAGTWDVFRVVRARRVHQPLWTTWYSTALSALSVVQALVRRPRGRPVPVSGTADGFAYPNLIVTNGPGTGFIVCLVAHLLKLLGFVPSRRFGILYIETWAHVSTLSLTGTLFLYSRLADMFVVQHVALARKKGTRYVGEVTRFGNLLGIRKALKR